MTESALSRFKPIFLLTDFKQIFSVNQLFCRAKADSISALLLITAEKSLVLGHKQTH